MKTTFNKSSIITTALVVMLLMSCVSDLNVKPIDPRVTTSADVYSDPASYKKGLAKLYAAFVLTGQQGPAGTPDVGGVDEGFSCFIRSLWNLNELTTDEAVWTYPNDANGTIFNLHYNTWVPSDGIPTALFARIMNVAALCNEFIRATSGKTSDTELVKMNAEARFLRALAYYHGLDLFVNMPFVSETDLPGAFFPKQKTAQELFKFIDDELTAIYPSMGDPKFEYGRADKGACAMLHAKLYLNSEIFQAPDRQNLTVKGPAMYTEAITEISKVIAGPYTLAPKFQNNFLADNDTSPEIIFAQTIDGLQSQSYNAVNVMIFGNAGNGGWSGLRTTSAFVSKFDVSTPTEGLSSSRAIFGTEAKGQARAIGQMNKSTDGYGVYKFLNKTSTGVLGKNNAGSFEDTDFPMFRLADAYLIYAEAVLRGGAGGSASTALNYVNAIRTRPGDVAAANAPGAITAGQLTLDFLIDERGRELYWEGQRRNDLIRFGKYTGATYIWPWKGGVAAGIAIEDKRAYFPIPAADIGSNPNLKQNTGY